MPALLGARRPLVANRARKSAIIYTQNWDNVTAPSVPADWIADTLVTTDSSVSFTGPNSLTTSADNTVKVAYYSTPDGNNGNVLASHFVRVDTFGTAYDVNIFIRGSNPIPYSGSTFYHLQFQLIAGVFHAILIKRIAGADTALVDKTITGGATAGAWYYAEIKAVGTTISARIQRQSDGFWLNTSGVFQAAEVAFASVTDSVIAGSGYSGVVLFNQGGTGARSDGFRLYKATATMAPATSLFITPSSLSGFANHPGSLINISADGSLASPATVLLSDGGAGGRFWAAGSFDDIAQVVLPANTQLGNAMVRYLPPYGRVANVTVSAVSAGKSSRSSSPIHAIAAYPTLATPSPTTLSFDQVATRRPLSLWTNLPADISGGFVTGLAGYTAINNVGSAGAVETVSSGVYSRSNPSLDNTIWYRSNTALANPGYNVELQVNSWGGGATDQLVVGVAQDSSNYVAGVVNHAAGTVALVKNVAGVPTTLASSNIVLSAGTKVLFQVANQWAAVWYLRPGDSSYTLVACKLVLGSFDWSLVATLAITFPFWGTSQSAGTSVSVTNFTCGHAGSLGLQNNRFVKDITTGAPLMSADRSKVYITGNAGMINDNTTAGSSGIRSPWLIDVWECDTQTFSINQVARLWFTRGGKVFADLPCAIGYNPGDGTYTLLTSSWPDFTINNNVDVYSAQTTTTIFSGVQYLAQTAVKLPNSVAAGAGSPLSQYDADLFLSGSTLYVSYTETNSRSAGWSNFYPCLSHSTTGIGGTFTQDFAKTAVSRQEGTVIAKIGGTQYVLAGSLTAQTAYDFSGSLIGNLSNITLGGVGGQFSNPVGGGAGTHPCLVAIPGETAGQTRYQFWMFDNTPFDPLGSGLLWNWGRCQIFEATQRRTASEYAWITHP